jgi:hypothetical protein
VDVRQVLDDGARNGWFGDVVDITQDRADLYSRAVGAYLLPAAGDLGGVDPHGQMALAPRLAAPPTAAAGRCRASAVGGPTGQLAASNALWTGFMLTRPVDPQALPAKHPAGSARPLITTR